MPLPMLGVAAGMLGVQVARKMAGMAMRVIGGRVGLAVSGAMVAAPVVARQLARKRGVQMAAVAGGGALVARAAFGGGGGRGGGGGMVPFDPGGVAYSWNTGTAEFHRLADGRIAVQRKNGTWKVYRPSKHIVVSRNPRVGTLIRADKRIDRLMRGLSRRMPQKRRRGTTAAPVTRQIMQVKQ